MQIKSNNTKSLDTKINFTTDWNINMLPKIQILNNIKNNDYVKKHHLGFFETEYKRI